jgi:hypothetical protein
MPPETLSTSIRPFKSLSGTRRVKPFLLLNLVPKHPIIPIVVISILGIIENNFSIILLNFVVSFV